MVQYQYCLLLHATETTVKQIEDAFKEFTTREDIAIVLISQYVSQPSHMHAYYLCIDALLSQILLSISYVYIDRQGKKGERGGEVMRGFFRFN
jgi:hypothetical protein